jgi:hypothetical protein
MKNSETSFIFAVIILCLISISCTDKQSDTKLPRSVPEAEGIFSKAIIAVLAMLPVCKIIDLY